MRTGSLDHNDPRCDFSERKTTKGSVRHYEQQEQPAEKEEDFEEIEDDGYGLRDEELTDFEISGTSAHSWSSSPFPIVDLYSQLGEEDTPAGQAEQQEEEDGIVSFGKPIGNRPNMKRFAAWPSSQPTRRPFSSAGMTGRDTDERTNTVTTEHSTSGDARRVDTVCRF